MEQLLLTAVQPKWHCLEKTCQTFFCGVTESWIPGSWDSTICDHLAQQVYLLPPDNQLPLGLPPCSYKATLSWLGRMESCLTVNGMLSITPQHPADQLPQQQADALVWWRLLLTESWLWTTPGKSLRQTRILPRPLSSGQHYLLPLLPLALFGCLLPVLTCQRLLKYAFCFSLPCWNETIKSLTDRSLPCLFTTVRWKAICLWSVSRVNTVIGVKPKVEQTLKTLMRF